MNVFDHAPYHITHLGGHGGVDFIIDFPAGKDITILQMTDTQLQTMSGVRTEIRKRQVGGRLLLLST